MMFVCPCRPLHVARLLFSWFVWLADSANCAKCAAGRKGDEQPATLPKQKPTAAHSPAAQSKTSNRLVKHCTHAYSHHTDQVGAPAAADRHRDAHRGEQPCCLAHFPSLPFPSLAVRCGRLLPAQSARRDATTLGTCSMHSNALVLTRSLHSHSAVSCPLLRPRLALIASPSLPPKCCLRLLSFPSRCSSCCCSLPTLKMLLSIASAALNRVLPRAASPTSIGRSMSTGANYVSKQHRNSSADASAARSPAP